MRKGITYLTFWTWYILISLVFYFLVATAGNAAANEHRPLGAYAAVLNTFDLFAEPSRNLGALQDMGFNCRDVYLNAFVCRADDRAGAVSILPHRAGMSLIVIDCQIFNLCELQGADILQVLADHLGLIEPIEGRVFTVAPDSFVDPAAQRRYTYFNYAIRIYPASPSNGT
jgi:hypothetical protein